MPTLHFSSNGTAQTEDNLIELRTEEVQELLGQTPNWMIRWGITMVFAIISLFLFASWLIKYPDILTSRVVLTTRTPPVNMVARAEGHLRFFVKNNEHVRKGAYLAVIESPANIKDIRFLVERLQDIKQHLDEAKQGGITTIELPDNLNLGESQNAYLAFLTTLEDYKRNRKIALVEKQIQSIRQRIQQYEQLNRQLEKQQQLLAEELQLAQKRFSVDFKLLEEKVIADLDFDRTKNALLQSKRAFESSQTEIINNQILIAQLQAQITEYHTNAADQEDRLRNKVETAFKQLESQLEAWEQRYVFKSPIDGEVAFMKYWSNNQFITTGEAVVTIVPVSKDLYAQVQLPITGSGKVESGQVVNIKFDNYPSSEYGMVRGIVQSISLIPQNNLYTIQIALPEGLTTSYHRELRFRQEMQGTAEIITKDLRLIERIFHQVRALLDTSQK